MDQFFPRQAFADLQAWYQSSMRRPLILRGARQVGKSTLVRHLAKTLNLDLFEVDLERHAGLEPVFGSLRVDPVLKEISVLARRDLTKSALIFLDEVQGTPSALAWLRYAFEERPDLPIVAAGSLLEFAIRETPHSIPVGRVEYLWLRPLSFFEFLDALGDSFLKKHVVDIDLSGIANLARTAHEKLLSRQREYLLVGGMPAVVRAYCEQGIQAARQVQDDLLTSYLDDLAKYSRKHPLQRLQRIFRAIPGNLGRRIKYVHLSRHDQTRDVRDVLDLLTMAGVSLPVIHSDCSGVPLSAHEDANSFKLLFLDVGLVCRSLDLDWSEHFNMDQVRLVNEGPLAEQFVGQEILGAATSREQARLHFWKRDKKQSEAEIDYVLASGQYIIPVEVKAGSTGSLRSLHQFAAARQSLVGLRLDASTPSISLIKHKILFEKETRDLSFHLISLPLYLASRGRALAGELARKVTSGD